MGCNWVPLFLAAAATNSFSKLVLRLYKNCIRGSFSCATEVTVNHMMYCTYIHTHTFELLLHVPQKIAKFAHNSDKLHHPNSPFMCWCECNNNVLTIHLTHSSRVGIKMILKVKTFSWHEIFYSSQIWLFICMYFLDT